MMFLPNQSCVFGSCSNTYLLAASTILCFVWLQHRHFSNQEGLLSQTQVHFHNADYAAQVSFPCLVATTLKNHQIHTHSSFLPLQASLVQLVSEDMKRVFIRNSLNSLRFLRRRMSLCCNTPTTMAGLVFISRAYFTTRSLDIYFLCGLKYSRTSFAFNIVSARLFAAASFRVERSSRLSRKNRPPS